MQRTDQRVGAEPGEHGRRRWMWVAVGLLVLAGLAVILFFALGGEADVDVDGGDVDITPPAVDADVNAPDIDVEAPDIDVDPGGVDVDPADQPDAEAGNDPE